MKTQKLYKWLFAFVFIFTSIAASSQVPRSVRRVMERNENQQTFPRDNSTATTWPDGSVHYPDGTIRYPDGRVSYPDDRVRGKVGYPQSRVGKRNLPPGHMKKLYGKKSARDYAYGHTKKSTNRDWRNGSDEEKFKKNNRHYKKHKSKKH